MLNTCKKTEIPPKPNKNAVIIILIDIFFMCIIEIRLIPFVISSNPVSIGTIKLIGKCKNLKNGITVKVSKFIKLLDLKIDIITENSTTKPPIINIVEIALEIDCAIISPRFDKLTFL